MEENTELHANQSAVPQEMLKWREGIDVAFHANVLPIQQNASAIRNEVAKVVVGMEETVDMLLCGMFVGGHVLLEGLPGIAKTMLAKLLAKAVDSNFSRIQFTPDLMPADVTGTSVFNVKEGTFHFRKGPVFSNLVLIDEINRSPAKTQAALMEVMEEKQITYDGVTYPMDDLFFVVATQNPVEQEGTYRLPEAQLDRFLFRLKLGYPDLNTEFNILSRFKSDFQSRTSNEVAKVIAPAQVREFRATIEQVYIREELMKYIAAIVFNTRVNGDLFMGASPRASLAILKSAKALAAIKGRDFVTPDDIRFVAVPVLNHRIVLSHEREMEGVKVEEVIAAITRDIEVPR